MLGKIMRLALNGFAKELLGWRMDALTIKIPIHLATLETHRCDDQPLVLRVDEVLYGTKQGQYKHFSQL